MGTARTWPAGPVWLALRADLRLRWRATLGLVLLLGLIGGVVLTAAAGARRTDTAYPRLLRWSHAASVLVVPNCAGMGGFYGRLARLPQVASLWTGVFYTLALPAPQAVARVSARCRRQPGWRTRHVRRPGAGPRGAAARSGGPPGSHGRPELAAAAHVRPGGTAPSARRPEHGEDMSRWGPDQRRPARRPAWRRPRQPVPLEFRVAAIVAFDDQVVPAPGLSGAPRVLLSPAFWRSGAGRRFGPGDYAGVELRQGDSLASFRRAAVALAGRDRSTRGISTASLAGQATATEQAIRPEAVALAAFAALAGLIGLAVLAQLLGRQLILDSADFAALSALGMTRSSLAALSLARVAAVTVPGACLAGGGGHRCLPADADRPGQARGAGARGRG